MIPVLSLIGGVKGGKDKEWRESERDGMCEEIVPERRKTRAKALRHEGTICGNCEQCRMAEAEEDEKGGQGQVMYYLVHRAKSNGSLYKISLSLRSIYNLQFTISPICKT